MSGSKHGGDLCPPYALLSGSWVSYFDVQIAMKSLGSSTWYLSLLKGVRVAGHILFQVEGLLYVPFRDGRSRGNDPSKGGHGRGTEALLG